jgi:hypothetical protein
VRLPPLLTAGAQSDRVPGALNQPGTVVISPLRADLEDRSGARLSGGYWLTDNHTLGVDATFFGVSGRTNTFSTGSLGDLLLGRPFVDAVTGKESALIIASFAQQQQGALTTTVTNHLWGCDGNLRAQVLGGVGYCVSLLGGVRHLELDEKVQTAVQFHFTDPQQLVSNPFVNTLESFAARNYFYGAQVGADTRFSAGPASMEVVSKLAYGINQETASIAGSTLRSPNGVLTFDQGGGFALPTNIGRYHRRTFALSAETGVTFAYQLSRHFHLTLGYSFLYITDVLRPGELIDRTLNMTQFPPPLGSGTLSGPARPTFVARDTEFWAQGLSIGLQFRY